MQINLSRTHIPSYFLSWEPLYPCLNHPRPTKITQTSQSQIFLPYLPCPAHSVSQKKKKKKSFSPMLSHCFLWLLTSLVLPCVALYGMPCLLFLRICKYKLLPWWQSCPCLCVLPYLINRNPGDILKHEGPHIEQRPVFNSIRMCKVPLQPDTILRKKKLGRRERSKSFNGDLSSSHILISQKINSLLLLVEIFWGGQTSPSQG